MSRLSKQIDHKFIDIIDFDDDWVIETDSGWQPTSKIMKTVEYNVYEIILENGLSLKCANDHMVFLESFEEIFVKDLCVNDIILTNCGPTKVKFINNLNYSENMYDIEVNSDDHRFYSNGILSHNSTSAAGFLLWYAMFIQDSTILIAANKHKAATEIVELIKFAYEEVPDWLRAGVVVYNVQHIKFDNGSRILSTTTTPDSGRGMAISLLYLDEFSYVRPKIAIDFYTAMSPTLSTGGKCIITSTPNSDEDKFAEIWFAANKTVDEYGNENPNGLGINGFKAMTAHYSEVPGRDEEWVKREQANIGIERFRREFLCVTHQTSLTIIDHNNIENKISIGELFNLLK